MALLDIHVSFGGCKSQFLQNIYSTELQQGIESFIGNILNDDLGFESFTHSTSKGSTSKWERCEDGFFQLEVKRLLFLPEWWKCEMVVFER